MSTDATMPRGEASARPPSFRARIVDVKDVMRGGNMILVVEIEGPPAHPDETTIEEVVITPDQVGSLVHQLRKG